MTADAGPGDDQAGGAGSADPYGNAADAATRFSLAIMGSGLRYTVRWSEILTSYLPLFGETLSRMSADTEGRAQAGAEYLDDLRAFVREMGDLPQQEARRLSNELEEIARDLWRTGTSGTTGDLWKLWRVKP